MCNVQPGELASEPWVVVLKLLLGGTGRLSAVSEVLLLRAAEKQHWMSSK